MRSFRGPAAHGVNRHAKEYPSDHDGGPPDVLPHASHLRTPGSDDGRRGRYDQADDGEQRPRQQDPRPPVGRRGFDAGLLERAHRSRTLADASLDR